jgi:hypothetical protein
MVMKLIPAGWMLTGCLLSLFLFSSFSLDAIWASQHKTEHVRIKPSRFNTTVNEFLSEFRTNFPQKPSPPPEKEEFETTGEFNARKDAWKKNYEKAVNAYRKNFEKTIPVYELHDLKFTFGQYNADKGYFSTINSSRLYVVGFNPLCDGYKIDASCPFGPMERYAHIIIKHVSIKREKAKKLKAITSSLRMRVGFQLIPPFPKDKGGTVHFTIHHVSIYDEATGETLFTITDQPLK